MFPQSSTAVDHLYYHVTGLPQFLEDCVSMFVLDLWSYISHMHAVCRLHNNIIIKPGVRFIIVCIGRINNQSEVRGQSV